MIIDRVYIIQNIIDKIRAKTYLEIGVRDGECFLRIRGPRKIAVDPCIAITSRKKRKFIFRNLANIFNRYMEMTSNEFFSRESLSLKNEGLDVVFIDGLHTYEQSLADVENSLQYISRNGVIVMHDCNPQSEAAAHPASTTAEGENLSVPGFAGEWNGDVWKTIVHLRSLRKDVNVIVLECDQGLGVIMKRDPESNLSYTREEINNLTYKDLDQNRNALLNLKPLDYFEKLLSAL